MRAQLDTAITMVLTLFIIAVVLTLAVYGFLQLSRVSKSHSTDAFFSELASDASSYANYGSSKAARIAAPAAFCVFNTTASDKTCVPDENGYAICSSQSFSGYWQAAGSGDGNVRLASGENEKVPGLVPVNGRYACFSAGQPTVFFTGAGRATKVSPMRKLATYTLTEAGGGSNTIAMTTYTDQPSGDVPALVVFDLSNAAQASTGYSASGLGIDLGGSPPQTLNNPVVTADQAGVQQIDASTQSALSAAGVAIPQLASP